MTEQVMVTLLYTVRDMSLAKHLPHNVPIYTNPQLVTQQNGPRMSHFQTGTINDSLMLHLGPFLLARTRKEVML